MQNSLAPRAAVSRAAPRTSVVSRNGVAFTVVSKRDDCEQKWQSSGQPPVLAERIPSTSTAGPHQARRTWWARAARATTAPSPRAAKAVSSSPLSWRRSSRRADSAAANSARSSGVRADLDLRGGPVVGRPAGRPEGHGATRGVIAGLVGHGAHGSGRASPPRSPAPAGGVIRRGGVHGLGFLHRARVRGEARVDAGVRARGGLPPRGPRPHREPSSPRPSAPCRRR